MIVLWVFGSLDLWVFGSLGLWVFGSLGLWIFGSLGLWVFFFVSLFYYKIDSKLLSPSNLKMSMSTLKMSCKSVSCKSSCNICCDDYNKSTRTKICCQYCDFDVCRNCCETYILSETTPKCMNPDCAKEWTRKFLRENFTNVFLTSKYKDHLENVLFDQEKALLPATQPLVEEKIAKENIRKQIRDLDLFIDDLYAQKRELEQRLQYGIKTEKAEKAHFVRQCPANGCRGFLSSQWKCGICERWSCPDCHELKGFNRDCDHICDPNNVETAKMLAKDSKPCPKCQSLIFKISGCDQMWCTQCHTAFSWKTGKLEKNVHNPHYYEWQRKNGTGGRNPGDVECGREIGHYTVGRIHDLAKLHADLYKSEKKEYTSWSGRKEMRFTHEYSQTIDKICSIIANVIHNNRVELPNFQTDYVIRNQDLRIKYLENSISEDEFKIQIQRNDKRNRKNTEIAQVLQLANTAVTDIAYRIMDNLEHSVEGKHNIEPFLKEMEEIIKYCNDIFRDISFTYNTVQYGFNDTFNFIRVLKEKKVKKKGNNEYNSEDSDEDSVSLKS